jgi:hypothetical protein
VEDVALYDFACVGALLMGLGMAAGGCATSTEFYYEGPGSPPDRATGTVPDGVIGVCRMANTARPILVNEKLWENARVCTPRTPTRFVRLGYTPIAALNEAEAIKEQEKTLTVLKDGQREDGGNNQLVALMRSLHERGLKDPMLRDRVSRQTTHDGICDYTYLLNTMAKQREKIAKGDKCAAQAYDTAQRTEVCLFDPTHDETVWLTGSWSCVTHTGALGDDASCFRLCNYDEYCAKHVSCGAPDVDLLMCALGVCVPEQRAGIF